MTLHDTDWESHRQLYSTLVMRGENADVLSAMSDMSESSNSDVELMYVMDPSDPRAHRSTRPPTRMDKNQKSSRWDSDEDDVGEPITVEDNVNEPITVEDEASEPITVEDSVKNATTQETQVIKIDADEPVSTLDSKKVGVTLSKWAQARFLVPLSQRHAAVIVQPPLEPLNDYILSDFSSRYRGNTGDMVVEEEPIAEEEQVESNKKQVGAPLFEANTDKKVENGEKGEKNSRHKKKKDEGRKRKETRYFITDLATKCFHCGEVGHMANVCTNDKLQPPCYYCALRGHQSWVCPNLPCANCLQLGHQEQDCDNRTIKIESCGICGRAGHLDEDCNNIGSQELLTCMVCTKVGHLHCVPVPPPADRFVYCPNCAKNHTIERCHTYREPAATNFASRTASGRSVQTCFVCSEAGHVAAECPVRSNGYVRGGNSCFNCGKAGHFAADCRSSASNTRSGRRVTGRKHGRDVEDEYWDYDDHNYYDRDDDYYSYDRSSHGSKSSRNKGGSSRSRRSSGNHGYARLNEALPTRPHRNDRSYGERRHNLRR
ncbi:unnamed protein product [Peronospora belbahrii]|uniref:CCHC-type domain-containing protein n=1 Tax=Peronospora belbahrii TaxID=622444 RepID=A0AAU9KS37_9STRA|nr:unnamed protein product [Peronospora belbahrii]